MAIFAKLAYAEGVELDALLILRFGLAGTLLLIVAKARGTLETLDRRGVLIGLGMGAAGYAAQAGLYFAALTRIDASQVALVFCTYPLLVMVVAVLIGRGAGIAQARRSARNGDGRDRSRAQWRGIGNLRPARGDARSRLRDRLHLLHPGRRSSRRRRASGRAGRSGLHGRVRHLPGLDCRAGRAGPRLLAGWVGLDRATRPGQHGRRDLAVLRRPWQESVRQWHLCCPSWSRW